LSCRQRRWRLWRTIGGGRTEDPTQINDIAALRCRCALSASQFRQLAKQTPETLGRAPPHVTSVATHSRQKLIGQAAKAAEDRANSMTAIIPNITLRGIIDCQLVDGHNCR
jgi:hypothetical protein